MLISPERSSVIAVRCERILLRKKHSATSLAKVEYANLQLRCRRPRAIKLGATRIDQKGVHANQRPLQKLPAANDFSFAPIIASQSMIATSANRTGWAKFQTLSSYAGYNKPVELRVK